MATGGIEARDGATVGIGAGVGSAAHKPVDSESACEMQAHCRSAVNWSAVFLSVVRRVSPEFGFPRVRVLRLDENVASAPATIKDVLER
jgi:hypothetical protein